MRIPKSNVARRVRFLAALFSCFIVATPFCSIIAQGGSGDPQISPDSQDNGVFLVDDDSVDLSVSPEPDPGEPDDSDCGCDAQGNPTVPEPHISTVWSGDVVENPDDQKMCGSIRAPTGKKVLLLPFM